MKKIIENFDQNREIIKVFELVSNALNCTNQKKNVFFGILICDPHISQLRKILVEFCPKFLDLYMSIYGNYFILFLSLRKL